MSTKDKPADIFGQLQESPSDVPTQGSLVADILSTSLINTLQFVWRKQAKIGMVQKWQFIASVKKKVNCGFLAKTFFFVSAVKRGTSKQASGEGLGSRNIYTQSTAIIVEPGSLVKNQPIIWSIYIGIKNGFCLLQVYILFSILSTEQTPRQS